MKTRLKARQSVWLFWKKIELCQADPKTKTYGGDEALENVLASIENLIQSHACNNVIIVGDMNTEMKRINGRVARMEKFLSDNELESA